MKCAINPDGLHFFVKMAENGKSGKNFLRKKLEWICCRVHVIGSVHWKASGLSLRPQVGVMQSQPRIIARI